jgi:hypothetical protein
MAPAASAAASAALRARQTKGRIHIHSAKEPVSFHLSLLLGSEYVLPVGKSSVDVLRTPFLRREGAQDPTDTPAFRLITTKNQITAGKPSNLTGTRLEIWSKKFVSSHFDSEDFDKAWQDRLLIVTEKRIFILTKKKLNSSSESFELSKLRNNFDLRTNAEFPAEAISAGMDCGQGHIELEIVDSIPMDEIKSVTLGDDQTAKIEDVNLNGNSFITRSLWNTASKLNLFSSESNDNFLDNQKDNRNADFQAADHCLGRFLK